VRETRFEKETEHALSLKMAGLWVVAQCCLVEVY
jgi:hypothetical protein